MKPYIDYNTEKRKHAVGKFAKDFYKLMNNSVFGRTMENVRNHCKHKIITDGEKLRKYTRLPNFYNAVDINDEITIVQMKHEMTELNKPIYAGSTSFIMNLQDRNSAKMVKCQNCVIWTRIRSFTIFR